MFGKKTNKKHKKMVSLVTVADKNSVISEQYRTIRTNIQYAMVDRMLKTIAVTSSGPEEGKSTTAANLAVVFADTGLKVLLIDADLRKPTIANSFVLNNSSGLSNLLRDRGASFDQIISDSGISNLWILPSGPKPPNPSEMLSSKRMSEVTEDLKRHFDLIIFDTPPIIAVTDAQIIAAKADGTILVVREGMSNKNALIRTKVLLENVKANVLGIIYNDSENNKDSGAAYYYYGD